MRFYTNTYTRGNLVFIRGYDNGRRFLDKVPYSPTFYLASRRESDWKTINGQSVEPVEQGSIREARDFVKQYTDVDGFTVYGSTTYEYACLNEKYGNDYDMDHIRVANIDIEVGSEEGFPEPADAKQPITAITVKVKGRVFVFGVGEYNNTRSDVRYLDCENENRLIMKFLEFWEKMDADIVTGWNVRFFDIPYLVNRISRLYDEKMAQRMSPLRSLNRREIQQWNRTQEAYELAGLATLDYLELYRKFTYTQQESYRLDHIAHVEIGEKKLDYSEVGTLHELYRTDYQKFIDYNIKDVELVERIDEKMKLIDTALAIAYDAKVNYADVFTQVRLWDVLIHNYLLDKKVVIPPKKTSFKAQAYAGAYVKEPQVGGHNWVMSFDLNSLYPHLIMQYNISPDTFVEGEYVQTDMDDMIDGIVPDFPKDKVLAANGHLFRKDKQGFLPEMMQTMYDERSLYKKEMIIAQKELETTKDKGLRYEVNKKISKYKNLQMAKKIQLNSAYGALGNQYFRFFDVRQAEAITLSGQLSIRWIEKRLNEYLNKLLSTEGEDYVIASDTDSVYITFDRLVDKVLSLREGETEISFRGRIVDFLDRVASEKVEPFIDQSYQDLADLMNAYEQKMVMAREVIADKGIWTAKKRYMLNVYDSEGVRFTEPKLKMMGIETVKSSTPQACRDALKEAIDITLNKTEEDVQKFISDFKDKFLSLPFEDIAFPRSLSDLNKYDSNNKDTLVLAKGTPIHVRGGLLYNHLIRKGGLEKRYQTIKDGEKIKFCYLKEPNGTGQNVISIINNLPPEFALEKFIDYDTQFSKAFIDPIRVILDVIGWKTEKVVTLEDFWK
jgi:DNA polymerase elongation subunit (family B)